MMSNGVELPLSVLPFITPSILQYVSHLDLLSYIISDIRPAEITVNLTLTNHIIHIPGHLIRNFEIILFGFLNILCLV